MCSNFNYQFNNFGGNNRYYKFFSFLIVTSFFNMISFTTVWIGKLLFNNNINNYKLYNQFALLGELSKCCNLLSHVHFLHKSLKKNLCLIRVSLVIHTIASLRYGFKPTLKIVVMNTLVAFTCKQLANFNKHS